MLRSRMTAPSPFLPKWHCRNRNNSNGLLSSMMTHCGRMMFVELLSLTVLLDQIWGNRGLIKNTSMTASREAV